MKRFVFGLLLLAMVAAGDAPAQTQLEYNATTATDTFNFWMQIPAHYDRIQPPAIMVDWHGYGGSQYELRDATIFDSLCNQRGWLAAGFRGPYDGKHYQCRRGQHHADSLLDWVMSQAPFSMDSIYMLGGSMGGAAGEIYHNNHCGIHDYMPAAVVGGSPILDCELRQQQYVDSGHTLDAMRAVFGGWPANPNGYPWDNDSIAFEYHRASAVHFADTTQSMHFNSLHLPVYYTWGISDSCWSCEWFAYGHPTQRLDTMRQLEHADCTVAFCSGVSGHGYPVLNPDSVMRWLSCFSANRFPADISINADENDEYYWTRVTLADTLYKFGRYGASRDEHARRLDLTLVRNVAGVDVEWEFPWSSWDSLAGHWINLDSTTVRHATVRLCGIPNVTSVRKVGAGAVPFTYHGDTLTVVVDGGGGDYQIGFDLAANDRPDYSPTRIALVSAYPNPFNSEISLEIESGMAAARTVKVYDVLGRLAYSRQVQLSPGTQRLNLSAADLGSGIYFVQLSGSQSAPMKIVLLK